MDFEATGLIEPAREKLQGYGPTVTLVNGGVGQLFGELAYVPPEDRAEIGFVFVCQAGEIRSKDAVDAAKRIGVPVAFPRGSSVTDLGDWKDGTTVTGDGRLLLPGSDQPVDHICVFIESDMDNLKFKTLELFLSNLGVPPADLERITILLVIANETDTRLLKASDIDDFRETFDMNRQFENLPHLRKD